MLCSRQSRQCNAMSSYWIRPDDRNDINITVYFKRRKKKLNRNGKWKRKGKSVVPPRSRGFPMWQTTQRNNTTVNIYQVPSINRADYKPSRGIRNNRQTQAQQKKTPVELRTNARKWLAEAVYQTEALFITTRLGLIVSAIRVSVTCVCSSH